MFFPPLSWITVSLYCAICYTQANAWYINEWMCVCQRERVRALKSVLIGGFRQIAWIARVTHSSHCHSDCGLTMCMDKFITVFANPCAACTHTHTHAKTHSCMQAENSKLQEVRTWHVYTHTVTHTYIHHVHTAHSDAGTDESNWSAKILFPKLKTQPSKV